MAGAITPTDFIARFPEFSSANQTLLQMLINEVVYLLRPYQSSGAYTFLQLYLTAHYLFLQQMAANGDASSAGPTSSKHVGEVSQGFAVGISLSKNVEFWNSTTYGQAFYTFMLQARYEVRPYGVI